LAGLDPVNVREPRGNCSSCRHFRNDPRELEKAFPGLTSLGSGDGSTRAQDGLCLRHDRYLAASSICADFSRRIAAPAPR
jgi:hypothetical protein